MTEIDIGKLSDNIVSLQKDMAQIGLLVDRLDVTIDKLAEVSSTASQLLAVQGSRLEYQEKLAEKLQQLIERRREETESSVKDLHMKVENVQKKLNEEIESQHNEIMNAINTIKEGSDKQHSEINDRITKLEQWMWMIVGGAIVLQVILTKIDITKLF